MENKVAITTTSFAQDGSALFNLLEKNGLEVIRNTFGRKLDKKEILEVCEGCIGIIAGTEIYDADVLKGLQGLKVISRCGTGTENIDIDTANSLGIKIFNTPEAPTLAVAELTIALILNLLRKINQMDSYIKNDKWEKLTGNLLSGKKVGIIGFGRIGQKVAELISIFGTEIAYHDVKSKSSYVKCIRKEFKEILSWADIITLHLSVSKEDCPIIGDKELNLIKTGGWLINVSRGSVVDEKALYYALKSNRLSGAALDVFEREPYRGPLTELNNVILTPHIGSYAMESRIRMEKEAVENLIKGLER